MKVEAHIHCEFCGHDEPVHPGPSGNCPKCGNTKRLMVPASPTRNAPAKVTYLPDAAFRAITDQAVAQIKAVEDLIDGVIAAAFNTGRAPRSVEYQDGVRASLMFRALARAVRSPYVVGTAQADAYFAGIQEGHALWRDQVELMLHEHRTRAQQAQTGTA